MCSLSRQAILTWIDEVADMVGMAVSKLGILLQLSFEQVL
jgi:hypothetical protein